MPQQPDTANGLPGFGADARSPQQRGDLDRLRRITGRNALLHGHTDHAEQCALPRIGLGTSLRRHPASTGSERRTATDHSQWIQATPIVIDDTLYYCSWFNQVFALDAETGIVSSPVGVPCTAPPWGSLDAIDLAAGKILWSVPLGTSRHIAPFPFWWIQGIPGVGGPIVTSTGLVFIGASLDHYLRAHDLATGEVLWKTDLPTSANSVPMTFQVPPGGRQYVVIAAGGHRGAPNPPGDHLMAFALPK